MSNNQTSKIVTVHPGLSGSWRVLYLGAGADRQRLPGTLDNDSLPTIEQYADLMAQEGYEPSRALPGQDTPRTSEGYFMQFNRRETDTEVEKIMSLVQPKTTAEKPQAPSTKPDEVAQAQLRAHLRNNF